MTQLDTNAIIDKWCVSCGPCDYGLHEFACTCVKDDHRPVILDLAREIDKLREELALTKYPRYDGDFIVLGPQIFTDDGGRVINWKGQNYVIQENGETRHIIELREDNWVIMHLLSCRPNLFACPFNDAAFNIKPASLLGKYYCDLSDDGELVLGGAV